MSRIHAWLSLALLAASLITPALSSAQVTRLQETDAAISYLANNWYDIPDPSLSGGNARGAFENGSTVSVTFTGTGLTWIGYRCACAAGIARLYLDGALLGTVDTYAAAPQAQAEIYSVDGLIAGEHNFTIEVTGNYHPDGNSAYVLVDAFDIEGSGTPPPADTVAPEVTLTAPADGADLSGAVIVTADASDNNWVQQVRLLVDGTPVGTSDSAAPYALGWDSSTVADGSHELSVVATDAAGNSAQDSITVQVANDGYLEEYHSSISYTGEWYDLNAPDVSGGSVVGSFHAGATATVNFNGTGITWIGYRCPCAAGIARVYVDGSLVDTVDTYAPDRVARAEIFSVAGLPAGEHTLEIEHTGNYHSQGDSAYLIVDAFRVMDGTGSNGGDTTIPTYSFTSPAYGSSVSGTVTFSADVQDDGGVAGVQFFVDGAPLGAEDTSAPYAASWDTTAAGEGRHYLTLVARDEAGNEARSVFVLVEVDNVPATDTTPPSSVAFETPTFGDMLAGTVTLRATGTDNVGITRIQYTDDDGHVIAESTTAPFAITWNTLEETDGGQVLRANAYDEDGNGITSSAHLVNIWNSAAPVPTATITAPADGATVSGVVTIMVDAFHPDGIRSESLTVQRDDGTHVPVPRTSTPYTYTWNTAAVPDGRYILRSTLDPVQGRAIYGPRIYVTVDN